MEGSDAAAVARARAGDREAFRVLVERHSRNVFRLAFRMTRSEEDAEDVVQETFLKAYRNLPRFAGQSEFSTWIHAIATHCAVDLLRRRAPRQERTRPLEGETLDEAAAGDATPERTSYGSEVGRRVARSLERLSPMERTAFVLRHFEGRTIAEIGRTLGVRSGAAKNCVFRAVAKLRRDLAPIAGAAR
jgi:RNA polymerase sigma-70 factor (ECF subfamily)